MGSHVVRGDFNVEVAVARAVKLRKENSLPASQDQFPVFNENNLGSAHKHGLHMGIGIALDMAIRPGGGHQAIQRAFGIGGHVGVGMLGEQDSSGGVWDIEKAG